MDIKKYTLNEEKLFARMAKSSKEFVVILGAGASCPSGLPNWEGLRDGLLKKLESYYTSIGLFDEEKNRKINNIRNKANLWDAFTILQQELHELDYTETIKELLSTKNKVVPDLYRAIWELDIAGIVTYNLDDFADKSKNHVSVSHWKEATKYANYLHNSDAFVFHPHGKLDDPSSWIMTRREKDIAYRENSFIKFMTSLVNSRQILIVGFNPSEQSFLDMLQDSFIDTKYKDKTIFYLYPSENGIVLADDYSKFADYGITTIPYNSGDNHRYVTQFFKQLRREQKRLQNEEQSYSVIKLADSTYTEKDIPQSNEMGRYTYNELRQILCGALSNEVSTENPTSSDIKTLNSFYDKYSEQLYEAWHINPKNANREANKIFNYTLINKIGKGAFGGVYEAEDINGNRCAIKVLLQEVTGEDNYLNCFRRGVRTMKILSSKGLHGIAGFLEAFEVPACIVMDFIDGYTLREAMDRKAFANSARAEGIKLELVLNIAKIINAAHKLEDTVLHRDLKPENIILEDFYQLHDDQTPSIKIVDFDLSWHRGAQGETVAATGSVGFVAPEQLPGQSRDKTKNAAVDVYSIGMLLFYIISERNPYPNQHAFKNFREDIDQAIKDKCNFKWQTTRKYLTEIVIDSTKQEQSERPSLSALIGKLETIIKMESSLNVLPSSHELLSYEIASRIDNTMVIEDEKTGALGDIIANQYSVGKTFKFNRIYRNGKFSLILQIIKQYTGTAEAGNIVFLTKKAINKTKTIIDKSIIQDADFGWETRSIIANLTIQLPDDISLDYVKNLSTHLIAISAEIKFAN